MSSGAWRRRACGVGGPVPVRILPRLVKALPAQLAVVGSRLELCCLARGRARGGPAGWPRSRSCRPPRWPCTSCATSWPSGPREAANWPRAATPTCTRSRPGSFCCSRWAPGRIRRRAGPGLPLGRGRLVLTPGTARPVARRHARARPHLRLAGVLRGPLCRGSSGGPPGHLRRRRLAVASGRGCRRHRAGPGPSYHVVVEFLVAPLKNSSDFLPALISTSCCCLLSLSKLASTSAPART